jgi:hypothetical protein
MVSEFHLNLGPSDTLEKIVLRLNEISEIAPAEKSNSILTYIENCDDKEIIAMKNKLTLNVPYRLQAPFMPEANSVFWKRKRQSIIDHINNRKGMIYSIHNNEAGSTMIRINYLWMDYLQENCSILMGWTDFNLITYLQRRNPTVPGISSKIYPPQTRKLNKVLHYWRGIANVSTVIDIYGGEDLSSKDITIDHFVPWSYVASDELWNLIPTTRSINSSKSNGLPRWEEYFGKLCLAEYSAYQITQENPTIHDLFEKCAKENLNSEEIRYTLYKPDQTLDNFSGQLESVLLPIYESARNLGFGEWVMK